MIHLRKQNSPYVHLLYDNLLFRFDNAPIFIKLSLISENYANHK